MASHIDEQTFMRAYDELADPLFRLCYFRLYDREQAKEVVQESFKKVWVHISKGKRVKNLKALLYKTTRNLIVDTARKNSHRRHDSLEEVIEAGREPAGSQHEQIMIGAEWAYLSQALEMLDAESRDLITLRYFEEYSPKELAELLGITPNAASVRLNRAMKAFSELAKTYL